MLANGQYSKNVCPIEKKAKPIGQQVNIKYIFLKLNLSMMIIMRYLIFHQVAIWGPVASLDH